MQMMKAVNTVRIEKGKVDEILPRFNTPKSVHTYEGFILMEVLKKEDSPEYDVLEICTTWQDRKFFDKWREARTIRKAEERKNGKQPEKGPIIDAELALYEVSFQHNPAK
ncbi:antibiotic biosynthesis monooxygenase [Filibacter tadaridae]|uniref:Heme-degrading monooxygenase n=1 Tax=Filibacter tadaridae TaxID=2483811 RepID=A0A3P5WSU8_9BACL|nr:antibiotic biosynthesis monooxygenase [Filibacter tadaridae]VDC22381.1 Heme-degrading monooxygenase [Filibacter tadaridae]